MAQVLKDLFGGVKTTADPIPAGDSGKPIDKNIALTQSHHSLLTHRVNSCLLALRVPHVVTELLRFPSTTC